MPAAPPRRRAAATAPLGARAPSQADEDAFMAALLAGIDGSAFDAPPSSQGASPSQSRGQSPASPQSLRQQSTPRASQAAPWGSKHRSASPSKPTPRAKAPSPAASTPKATAVGRPSPGHPRRQALSPRKTTQPLPLPQVPSAAPSQRVDPFASFVPKVKSQQSIMMSQSGLSETPVAQGTQSQAKRKASGNELMDFLGLAPAKRVASEGRASHPPVAMHKSPSHAPATQRAGLGTATLRSPTGPFTSLSPITQGAQPPPALPDPLRSPSLQSSQEDYDAEWDLDALAIMDEAALLSGPAKYPLLHPPVPPIPHDYNPAPWARCFVDSVHDGLLNELPQPGVEPVPIPSTSTFAREKTLVVTLTETGVRRLVHLKDRWSDLNVRPKDIVNVISHALHSDRPIVVTMKDTVACLIHHPDVLVTMTAVADAMPCPRRPLVQQLVKLPEAVSKSMLYGTVLHSLLQGSLSEQSFDADSTAQRVRAELSLEDRRLEVWGAGFSPDEMVEELGPLAEKAFVTFGDRWVGPHPTAVGGLITARDEPCGSIAIRGLHDIEESIWSPKWGLQGKVDASVQAVLRRGEGDEEEEFVAPLEIKTGKSIGGLNHRAQTMLYTLLMEDRYGLPVPAGLLYYSQRSAIVLIEARANEVRALIMARNELAEWMARDRSSKASAGADRDVDPAGNAAAEDTAPEAFLPETLDRPKDCRRCFAADACMLYRKAVDRVPPPEYDDIAELYQDKTGHLTDTHGAFFKHWERLLSLEERDTKRLRAQLWTMTAKARESAGRCFSDMVIASEQNEEGTALTKIHKWTYTFTRAVSDDTAPPSLLSGHISVGDPVQISLEPDLLCLARGFITALSSASVSVGVQLPLKVDELLKRTRTSFDLGKLMFRIDKDELSSGMARMRGNLAHIFLPNGDHKRRSLVVDLRAPEFDQSFAPRNDEVPAALNEDQRAAMAKVLTAKDYALVLGMPGTGKTTTVAEIIKALVDRKKSVLLTSYTHSAVDTIVTKLLGADFQMLRIGNRDKVHPDVRHLTLEAMGPSASVEQLEARLMTPPVVATTCLSVNHPLFFRRQFDYCIVDEASQITLPTCLGPLRCAKTFVLVGDHFQLPPIVRKAEARAGGLDVSLFRRLSDAHPEAVAPLAAQYRMNADIMQLSNRLIYENRLRCGSDEVAQQALVLRSRKQCREIGPATCGDDCWVQDLLEESAKAIFVDTDQVPAVETRAGDLVQNPTEAALVYTLAQALVASGVRQHDIAVITPYRQQIKLFTALFAHMPGVELLTADRAQGRDKDVILCSLVRSNEGGYVGDLLRDWRRINVSFTRARKKLVIFGSRSTLASDRLMADFFTLVDERGWVRQLPANATRLHAEVSVPPAPVSAPSALLRKRNGTATSPTDGTNSEKRASVVSKRLLNGRPFVRELLDQVNDHL